MSNLTDRVNRLSKDRPAPAHRPLQYLTDAELDDLEALVLHVEAHGWDQAAYDLLATDAIQSALGKLRTE